MRKALLLGAIALMASLLPTLSAMAQIPAGYYDSLKGKKGAELKNAIYGIIKDAKVLTYGSGAGHTWAGFYDTDRDEKGRYIDRYSDESEWVMATSKGAVGAGMNIEHSFPKSWWGKTNNQAYKDLYNLMPCKSQINSTKSNFPMGEVVSGDKGNGWTKVGNGKDGKKYWEPADPWKGDFARGYMYMATTYQNFNWEGTGLQILQQGAYPTLQKWAYTLYIKWAKEDKVDALEMKRNNDVSKIQGNRNPYVDFPNLMEYVWGDSIDYAFNPETTVKSSDYNGGGDTPDVPTEGTILSLNFLDNDGGCQEQIANNESSYAHIWILSDKYGWKATAYNTSTGNHKSDATLYLPEIDLSEYANATMTINQALNFAKGKGLDYLSVTATITDPTTGKQTTTKLPDYQTPSKDSWAFSDCTLNLAAYCGKKVTIGFHYTSDEDNASTWEIKKINITGTKKSIPSSIHTATDSDSEVFDFSQPFDIYAIDGKKLDSMDGYKGIVILRQNGKTIKMSL